MPIIRKQKEINLARRAKIAREEGIDIVQEMNLLSHLYGLCGLCERFFS